MSFFRNPCNIYFSLWSLYLLQGTLYESGSLTSQILLLIILLISVKDAVMTFNMPHLPVYFKGLNALVLMFTIYGVFLFFTDGVYVHTKTGYVTLSSNYLRTLYYSILPVYSCYLYTRRGYLTGDVLKKWVLVFVVIAVSEFVRFQREKVEQYLNMGSERKEFTNNIGYIMLLLTPCAFIYQKKPLIQFIIYGICMALVFVSMKRGAILIAAIAALFFFMDNLKLSGRRTRYTIFFFTITTLVVLYYLAKEMMMTNELLNQRIEATLEGDSSGRNVIYSDLINHFVNDANIFQMIFGMGAEGTMKVTYNWAHNDWLEILTNQGIIGVSLFAFYWLDFWKTSNTRSYSRETRFVLKYIFLILLLRTFFSMSIGDMSIYSSCMLGYALADGFKRDFKLT